MRVHTASVSDDLVHTGILRTPAMCVTSSMACRKYCCSSAGADASLLSEPYGARGKERIPILY
ncbi:hypothetical protein BT96DRAFT_916039, partial [Gymnopus androsaceus JB14]